MSKVQNIHQDYSNNQVPLKKVAVAAASVPSFKAKFDKHLYNDILDKSKKEVLTPFQKSLPGRAFNKFCNFLNNTKGEVQNNLLNSVFTATLAPFMIKNNPFYHKDENSKEYFALRQPISAGIALSGGLAMSLGINRFLDTMTNDGSIKSIDSRVAPTDSYLKRNYRKEYATAIKTGKVNEFYNRYNIDVSADGLTAKAEIAKHPEIVHPTKFIDKVLQHKRIDDIFFNHYKDVILDERKNVFKNLKGENPKNVKIDEATSIIYKLDDKGNKIELGRNIPNFTKQEHLDAYMAENNLYNIKFKDLLGKNYSVEVYGDNSVLKDEIKKTSLDKLDEIKGMDFARDTGMAGDATTLKFSETSVAESFNEESLNQVLNELSDDKTAKKIKENVVPKALVSESSDKTLAKAVGKAASRATKFTEGGIHQENIRLKQVLAATDHLEKEKNLNSELGKPAIDVLVKIAKKLGVVKAVNNNAGKFELANGIDFAENMIAKDIKGLGKFKTFSTLCGIGFNLVTTAITCTVLNYVYPRFVDTYFPELSEKKSPKAKEGGKA